MSAVIKEPTLADRETIYAKLRFLSSVVGSWEKLSARCSLDGQDFFALSEMLSDISDAIYPEWKGGKDE